MLRSIELGCMFFANFPQHILAIIEIKLMACYCNDCCLGWLCDTVIKVLRNLQSLFDKARWVMLALMLRMRMVDNLPILCLSLYWIYFWIFIG